jgi:hypothetical protein
MAIVQNPLNRFATYNYIWKLAVATPDDLLESSGYSYRNKSNFIVKSGGVGDTKTITTLDEDARSINVEYFIDDVTVDSIVSPNPFSGITFATNVEFKITEPYSISLFLQTLFLAAQEAGYTNYLDAPYVLECEFVGFDAEGQMSSIEKRVLLIKLTDINFSVDAGGSIYNVTALPWTHGALTDTVQRVRTDITIGGSSVSEILIGPSSDASTQSLVQFLNVIELEDAERTGRSTPNEYVIEFPDNISDITNNLATSTIVDDLLQGNPTFGIDAFVYENGVYRRGDITVSGDTRRIFQFTQGMTIEKIIEEVILTSNWVTDLIDRARNTEDGYIDWFKVFTRVEVIDPSSLNARGESAKRFIYSVYPYRVHISTLPNTGTEINYSPVIDNIVKAYNYIYTGRNLDILDFNIKIDYAFINVISRDYGAASAETVLNGNNRLFLDNAPQPVTQVDPGIVNRVPELREQVLREEAIQREELRQRNLDTDYLRTHYGGANLDTAKARVARIFNNAILNSDADLIEVDLTIWGDPYYLSDSDYGNYIATAGSSYAVNSDGIIDFIRGEVDILLKFSNPVDYQGNLLSPTTTTMFTGVYKVVRLLSTFSRGEFKQELKLLRRRSQDDETVQNAVAIIDAAWNASPPPAVSRSAVFRPPNLLLRFAENQREMLYGAVARLGTSADLPFVQVQSELSSLQNSLASIDRTISSLRNLDDIVQERTQALVANIGDVGSLVNSVFGRATGSAPIPGITSELASLNARANPFARRTG